ncbi:hypothetical protein BU52_06670 [Streptomyces toyocaensis]|uniref:Uncharacterized protein n=1 Tax=Streptomyces toyocaensis TaxID=55952 RepID=A0A081XX34_STRTO|nr:hypothetical protein [Streptomyces toyocaensis]KES08107.1 hypothetical protein BU52_06670 [Streptomyces toyocaensis]
MKTRTLFRTSPAVMCLPIAIGITVLYYTQEAADQIHYFPYPWAPLLVQRPIEYMAAPTYALVAALAAWSAARVREAGTWQLAAYRPTWQVIAQALVPVVTVGWLMFVASAAWAFTERPTWPTPASLPPLLLTCVLTVAWAVIGFTVGHHVKPLIAAPVLACGVFIIVAYPHAMQPFALRHLSGEYFAHLGVGESATAESMAAQMMPTLGVAAAVALVWARRRPVLRALTATALVVAPTLAAYGIVKDWDYNPSLNTHVALACQGTRPQVCLPEQGAHDLPEVHAQVARAFRVLETYAVTTSLPQRVVDQLAYGRFTQQNTDRTAYMQLGIAHHKGRLDRSIVAGAVRFGCDADPKLARTIHFWLEKKLGDITPYQRVTAEDPYYTRAQYQQAVATVERVSAQSVGEQKQWFAKTKAAACEGRPT